MLSFFRHFTALVLVTSSFSALGQGYADRLRVLFVIDSPNAKLVGDDISKGCSDSLQALKFTLEFAFEGDPTRVTIDTLKGDDVNIHQIAHYYQNLQTTERENLLFYYCGHGAFDEQKGHFLATGRGGNLLRTDLRNMMVAKRARGTIILTDACSSFGDAHLGVMAMAPEYEALYDLLLGSRGIVDITAAQKGKPAWFTQQGGIFSEALYALLNGPKNRADFNGDGFVDWHEGYAKLRESMQMTFTTRQESAPKGSRFQQADVQVPAYYFLGQ